jgi:putative membrane protein
MANMAEIQIGHMATEKAQNAAVKNFARQMVEDHIRAQNELADAALGAGVQWPKALDSRHAALKTKLSSLSGAAFDREYMKAMVDGHREVEKTLAARASAPVPASDLGANVTEWSAKTVVEVREHLKKAEEVSAELAKVGTR